MSVSTEVKIYANQKKVVKAMAKEIYNLTISSSQERFHICLSGGKTPSIYLKK
jgi:6-phosphogluconolactonase/glucosamine-6-phosphate isomerase/deaminase